MLFYRILNVINKVLGYVFSFSFFLLLFFFLGHINRVLRKKYFRWHFSLNYKLHMAWKIAQNPFLIGEK